MSASEFAFGVAVITVGILLAVITEKYLLGGVTNTSGSSSF